MNIKPDFNQNIIIYTKGIIQIQILSIIYHNINKLYNTNFILNKNAKYITTNFDEIDFIFRYLDQINVKYEELNNRFDCIYIPNKSNLFHSGCNFIIKDIKSGLYFEKNPQFKGYKLIDMKEFLDIYGKYLFESKDDYQLFINKHDNTDLSKSPIYQFIKKIKF